MKTPDTSHEASPKAGNDGSNLLAQRQYTVRAMKNIKVNQLAGQLKALFNISYLSFLGHVSTCATADAGSKKDLALGQLPPALVRRHTLGASHGPVPIRELFQR